MGTAVCVVQALCRGIATTLGTKEPCAHLSHILQVNVGQLAVGLAERVVQRALRDAAQAPEEVLRQGWRPWSDAGRRRGHVTGLNRYTVSPHLVEVGAAQDNGLEYLLSSVHRLLLHRRALQLLHDWQGARRR